MKDDINRDGRDGRTGDPVDAATIRGIEVDELMDVDRIELGSRAASPVGVLGWETVPPLDEVRLPIFSDDGDDLAGFDGSSGDTMAVAPAEHLARLEQEHLLLAAELATLRRSAGARERVLESELAAARATIDARETELGEQVAQIASLTLECGGLRASLKPENAAAPVLAQPGTPPAGDNRHTVARLKERLLERGHAITLARGEIEALQRECMRLRQALARHAIGGAVPPEPPPERPFDLRASLRRLFHRLRGEGAGHAVPEREDQAEQPEHRAAFAGEPGSEVPTIAMEKRLELQPAFAAAVRSAAQSGLRAQAQVERRREAIDRAVQQSQARHAAEQPALRRYLIALDPDREEVHELSRKRMYVGRGAEADVHLGDATVSRLHGTLALESGATFVEDASSVNGIFVNAKRVRRAALRDGDTVTFGTARFQYRIGPTAQNSD
jgi:hypothetical protein